MSLTPRERFQMLREIVHQIDLARDDWTWADIDLLLRQFELGGMDPDSPSSVGDEFGRSIATVPDSTLLAIYATVLGIADEEALATASSPDDHGLWHDGQVRLFISHSAREKEFAADVSRELAVVGVHGFVAHDSMQIEKSWQAQIETALRTAEAFVGFVHPPFNESAWCQQEIGWATGRNLPQFYIRLGADPQGFISPTQWPSLQGRPPKHVATEILKWLERSTGFTSKVVDGFMQALQDTTDYYSAEAAAKRIVALGELTDEAWSKLAIAYWANDQVHGGVLPTRVLKPFYLEHDKEWPPPK